MNRYLSSEKELELKRIFRRYADEELNGSAIYHTLSEAIIANVLPPGWRLGEERLAALFAVSRTPIREALMRLENEQLAERRERRGLVVGSLTAQQILDIYIVREGLEGMAARLAARLASPTDITELKHLNRLMTESHKRGKYDEIAHLNVHFHQVLARASRNQLLERFISQIYNSVRRFQNTTFSYPGRTIEALKEHERLIAALEAHDTSTAEMVVTEHISKAMAIRMEMHAPTTTTRGEDRGKLALPRTAQIVR